MAGQFNAGASSGKIQRKYKWHHLIVSLLCVMAIAAVVSSLFSTINTIHNVKKKRDLSRRSVEESFQGNDTIALGGGGGGGSNNDLSSVMVNVMEINHSISTNLPQQQPNALVNSSSDLMKGDHQFLSPSLGGFNNSSITATANQTVSSDRDDEDKDGSESDFESAEPDSDQDESGEGSASDQVDSIEVNTTKTTATSRVNMNLRNVTGNSLKNSTEASGEEIDDDGDNGKDDEVDDKTDDNESKTANSTMMAVSQQKENKPKVWYLASTSTPSPNKVIAPQLQKQITSNKTMPRIPSKNNTASKISSGQPAIGYTIATYGVIGGASQTVQAPKNQSVDSSKQTKQEEKQPVVTKNSYSTKQQLTPNSPSNKTAEIISSSLYPEKPYSRNIAEEHKDGGSSSESKDYPTFPSNYHASGIIILPNSKIAEPFEIWYAPVFKRSRIDYYYGNDKTYQFGDEGNYGVSYKYVPMFNDKKKNFEGCYTLTGTPNRRIIAQVITPNMTWFKYNKTEVYTGVMTTKWTYQYTAFGMKNFQSVWITKAKPYRPIRYEMFGFDMMLGSYYDNYVINYVTFEEWSPDGITFRLPSNMKCFNWTNSLEASLAVNPMQEFTAFSPESAVDHHARYAEFKNKHYESKQHPGDSDKRKHVYKHNARFINSHNRKNLSYKLKVNMFTDKFDEELNHFHGSLEKDTRKHEGIKEFHKLGAETSSHPPDDDIPEEIDWRNYGAVSSVGGQGICGSCYAFSAAEAVEGAWYRKTSKMVRLSKQQLVDCSWGFGNHGCKGGHYAGALSWIFVHGISTAKSYGKYLGQEGYCHFNDTWFGANIEGFAYVPVWNSTALKRTIAMHGPVAISINTIPLSFKFYSKGIYDDPKCEKNRTTHSALVVGYGKKNGKGYWIVKNSWSRLWGEGGYIRVAMKDDLCGVTEYPVAVIVKHPSFKIPKIVGTVGDDSKYKLKTKEADKMPDIQGENIPINPSGTKEEQHNLPGRINEEKKKEPPNEDEEDDEDEKVEKQNKKVISNLQQQQQKQQQIQEKHQTILKQSQQHEGVFEKALSSTNLPGNGLHIDEINDDIKKIHKMLVNTASIDQAKKKVQQNGESVKAFEKVSEKMPNFDGDMEHGANLDANKKSLKTANKAEVASPARPVHTTTSHAANSKNKLQSKKNSKNQKDKKKNSKEKSSTRKPKQKSTKKQSHKDMKDELKDLIKKLDYAELATLGTPNLNNGKESSKKADTHPTTTSQKTLNPENIGSLSHTKRSKTNFHSVKGTKKSTISRVQHSNKQKQHQLKESSRKRKTKIEKGSKRSNSHSKAHSNSVPSYTMMDMSPVRKTMDLNFLGLPNLTIKEAIAMERRPTKRGKITMRKSSLKSHKKSKIERKKTAIEEAKENSLDNLYSLIDQKVRDYTFHSNKKRDMNFYKHHIRNG